MARIIHRTIGLAIRSIEPSFLTLVTWSKLAGPSYFRSQSPSRPLQASDSFAECLVNIFFSKHNIEIAHGFCIDARQLSKLRRWLCHGKVVFSATYEWRPNCH